MSGRALLTLWVIAVAMTVAIVLAVYGAGEEGIGAAVRATARLSTFAIACAFAGIRTRAALIALPISHAAHYALIAKRAAITSAEHVGMNAETLIVGTLIYSLMVFAAFRAPRWAIYVLWMIFLYAILVRVHTSWIYPPIVLLLLAAAAVRFTPRRVETRSTT